MLQKIIFLICFSFLSTIAFGETSADESSGENIEEQLSYYRTQNMGTYRIRVGALRHQFTEGFEDYDNIYGNTTWSGHIAGDWIPVKFWWLGLGGSARFHYNTQSGPGIGKDTSGNLAPASSGESRFNMYSIQGVLLAHISPFYERYFNVQLWAGYEYLYTSTIWGSSGDTMTDSFKQANETGSLSYGASLDIGLGILDSKMMNSLRLTFGIDQVYLSLFVERYARNNKDEVNRMPVNRDLFGLGFTFETRH